MRAIYFVVLVFLTLLISEGYSATKAGKVIEVSGKTDQLRLDRIDKRLPLKLDDPLFFMDTVLTGDLSTARLHLTPESDSDVKLFVYENSQLKIEPDLLKGGKRYFVAKFNRGLMHFFAKGIKKNNEELRLNLPNCVVGVRGTEGEVYTHEGEVTAAVLSLVFGYGDRDDDSIKVTVNPGTDKEKTYSIAPGKKAVVKGVSPNAYIEIIEDLNEEEVAGDETIDGIRGEAAYKEVDGAVAYRSPVPYQALDMSNIFLRLICTCGSRGGLLCGSTPDDQNDCALLDDFNG